MKTHTRKHWLLLAVICAAGVLSAWPLTGWCAKLAAGQRIVAKVRGDILNNGCRSEVSLTKEPIVSRLPDGTTETGPESKFYLRVIEPRDGRTVRRIAIFAGTGVTGKMIARDLTGDGKTEVFVFVDGQSTYTRVYRFAGGSMKLLFKRGEGRPQVDCLRVRSGGWEIVEHVRMDAYDNVPDAVTSKAKALAGKNGIPSIIRTYRWDKRAKRFQLKGIVAERP